MKWMESFSPTQIKLIGLVELLGGLGVILPWATVSRPVSRRGRPLGWW